MAGIVRAALALLGLGLVLTAPSQAMAARGLDTGFSDNLYLGSQRSAALDESVEAGASIARINIVWRSISSSQPVSPASPLNPAYDFTGIDAAVRAVTDRGLAPLLTVYAAPDYAEGADRPSNASPGTWKPDPAAYGDFAHAVAERYSGSTLGLPRVRYYQAWNEQNLSTYLTPQYDGNQAVAVTRYRDLLNAFYANVKAVHADNQVVTGGTAPYGDPPGSARIRPLTFWRDLLCLNNKLHSTGCAQKANFDILAHHPINTSGGPTTSAVNPNDASTPDFHNVVEMLRAAERANTTGTRGKHPTWATELWWDTDPPDNVEGIPLARQAKWLEQSLYSLWKQGASAVINLQVQDSPFDPHNATADNSTGVFFADGTPKPSLTAWRFPLVADRVNRKKVELWAKAPVAGKVAFQLKQGKRWRTVAKRKAGAGAVVTKRIKLVGHAKLRAKVGGEKSLVWEL